MHDCRAPRGAEKKNCRKQFIFVTPNYLSRSGGEGPEVGSSERSSRIDRRVSMRLMRSEWLELSSLFLWFASRDAALTLRSMPLTHSDVVNNFELLQVCDHSDALETFRSIIDAS
ncbi:hypothetical protein PC120_g18268 [Phytophthora cactorum]|nr:hypothetical protein PC120_g18268 [Phytophthora cactorum]